MKRYSRVIFPAVMAALLLGGALYGVLGRATTGGCGSNGASKPNTLLNVEGDSWSGYATFRDPSFLQGKGYTFTYATELDQAKRACDLTTGKADFIVTTADQYVKNMPSGRMVGLIDQSKGADALVLNTKDYPSLTGIERLPGAVAAYRRDHGGKLPKLSYTGDSPSDFLLHELAAISDDLKLTDFELISVDQSPTALTMLQNHEVLAAVLWEPDTSAAKASGYVVALSSQDAPDMVLDVLVASDRIIRENPQAVQDVVNAFYAQRAYFVTHPQEFVQFIAKDGADPKTGTPMADEDVQSLLAGVKFYDAREADEFFNSRQWPLRQTQMQQSLESIGALVAQRSRGVKIDASMIDGSFVQTAAAAIH